MMLKKVVDFNSVFTDYKLLQLSFGSYCMCMYHIDSLDNEVLELLEVLWPVWTNGGVKTVEEPCSMVYILTTFKLMGLDVLYCHNGPFS